MRRIGLIVLCVIGVGCGKYQAGDIYEPEMATRLYFSEKAFQDEVIRKRARVLLGEDPITLSMKGDLEFIRDGTFVKIIEGVDGGAKAVISKGPFTGKIGWIHDDDLPPARKVK